MGDFQQVIADALSGLSDSAGVEVTYHRGNDWVRLTAVPGSSTFTVDDGYGAIVKTRSRDYLLNACDLVLAGSTVTPAKGDLVKEAVGNQIHVHEVLRPDNGDEVFRYSDHGRTRIRVHTKLKQIVNRT